MTERARCSFSFSHPPFHPRLGVPKPAALSRSDSAGFSYAFNINSLLLRSPCNNHTKSASRCPLRGCKARRLRFQLQLQYQGHLTPQQQARSANAAHVPASLVSLAESGRRPAINTSHVPYASDILFHVYTGRPEPGISAVVQVRTLTLDFRMASLAPKRCQRAPQLRLYRQFSLLQQG